MAKAAFYLVSSDSAHVLGAEFVVAEGLSLLLKAQV
jgi:hypothetical protein